MKMINKRLLIINMILCFYTATLFATDYTFSGSGAWTDASKWSPSYPGLEISNNDTVIIVSGANCTTPYGFTYIRFMNASTFINNGTLNNHAIFDIRSTFLNKGMMNNNYYLITSGRVINDSSATYNGDRFSGRISIDSGGLFENKGTAYISFDFVNRGTFTNTGTLEYAAESSANGIVNLNGGEIIIASSYSMEFLGNTFNWNAGKLTLRSSSVLSYSLTIPSGGILNISNFRTVEIPSGVTLTNNGTIEMPAANLTLNTGAKIVLNTNPVVIPNGLIWKGGTITIGASGNFVNSSTFSIESGRVLEIVGTFTNNDALNLNSGGNLVLNKNPSLMPGGTFNWNPGGKVIIGTDGNYTLTNSFTLDNGKEFQVDGTFTNNGTINLNSTGNFILNTSPASLPGGNFNWNDGGNVTIGSSGNFTLPKPFTLQFGRRLQVNTNGTVNIDGTMTDNGILANAGILNINSNGNLILDESIGSWPGGKLNLNSGGTVILGASGSGKDYRITSPLNIVSGASLVVNGRLFNHSTLTNDGAIVNNNIVSNEIDGTIINNYILNTTNYGTMTNYGIFINNHKLDNNYQCTMINNAGGTWTENDTLTNTGTLTNNGSFILNNGLTNNATLDNNGILTINAPATLDNLGTVINSDSINTNGIFNNSAILTNTGTFNLNSGGNLYLRASTVTIPAGTFNWNPGGRLNIFGTLSLTNLFTIPAGRTLLNYGRMNIQNNGILDVKGTLLNNTGLYLSAGGNLVLNTAVTKFPSDGFGIFDWGSGSTVTIGNSGSLAIDTLPDTLTIHSGRALVVNGNLTIKGNHYIDNRGTMTITSTVTTMHKGALTSSGILNLQTPGNLIFDNYKYDAPETSPPSLLGGTINWGSGANVTIGSASSVTISGSLTIPSSSILSLDGKLSVNEGGSITNNGTMNLDTTGNFVLNTNPASLPRGTFNWFTGGTVTIGTNGSLTIADSLTIPSGDTLKVNGILTNNGSMVNYGILVHNGSLNNIGTLNLNYGSELILNKNPSLIPGGTFNWNSGGKVIVGSSSSYIITSSMTLDNGKEFQIDGTLTNNGTLNLNSTGNLILNTNPASLPGGTFNWNSGGKLTIGPSGSYSNTGTLTIDNSKLLQLEGNLSNSGTLNIESTGNLIINRNSTGIPIGGTINWNSGGIVTVGPKAYFQTNTMTVSSGRIFVVNGEANVSGGDLFYRNEFTNNGKLTINGKFSNYNTSTNNGTINGIGAITSGSFVNTANAVYAPGNSIGTLTAANWFNLSGGATYNCEIDGATGKSDTIIVASKAILTNAKLNVSWLTKPVAGTVFKVMTFTSRTDTFATITIPPVSGFTFNTTYTENAVIITAIVGAGVTASIDIKIMLEGSYESGSMKTTLKDGGLLPLIDPFSGTYSVTAIPPDVVDWVKVELRDKDDSTSVVASKVAFVLKTGHIVALDETNPVSFPVSPSNSYFIVVKQRNHLAIMSKNPVPFVEPG